jgi:pimeloyl-ACP methyl ester carboxylesterase
VATVVLVHGAFAGGYKWKQVRPRLQAAGHEVFSPTLTGLGERVHLASPDVTLETHLIDVFNVLRFEDLRDVVLVGHSYGGMVITGVADRAADRVRRLVYLDALVPNDGESVEDVVPPERRAEHVEGARTQGDGWLIPADNPDAGDVPQPLATFTSPLRLPQGRPALPRLYIRCLNPPLDAIEPSARRVLFEPGWDYRELQTAHDAPATDPEGLSALLLEWI